MDSLRAMFPDLGAPTLQAALEAHGNSVERTVDYLLSSHTAGTERTAQEEGDAALARRLQAEDMAMAREQEAALFAQADAPPMATQRRGNAQEGVGNNGAPFSIPSMADVQSAVQPLVNGVAYAGRVAADSVSGLYRELVGDAGPSSRRSNSHAHGSAMEMDESVVLRGDGSSPAATRNSTRQRRPEASSFARSFGDKKDD